MNEVVSTPSGRAYEIAAATVARLSKSGTKRGQLQRAALAVLLEHEADGALPTSTRFVFYELEQRGVVSKVRLVARRADQDLTEAVMALREAAVVPWGWIVDETRTLSEWDHARSVAEYLRGPRQRRAPQPMGRRTALDPHRVAVAGRRAPKHRLPVPLCNRGHERPGWRLSRDDDRADTGGQPPAGSLPRRPGSSGWTD